ncbi:MAG: L,D-transpeptidase [Bdellovibrionaceae bacterium]|nr:L,D-transpeptidase [Pseudobdellovibrionaceae bacterium]
MPKLMTLALSLILSLPALAQTNDSLHDVLSPDEVATELGIMGSDEQEIMDISSAGNSSKKVTFDSQASILLQYYPLVVVVNKAARGPGAQHARIYVEGSLWKTVPVSTGREQQENSKSGKKYFSATSVGWFNPTYLVENHFSNTWQADMPWSTFFNGGIALHAALPPYYGKLGTRASGGCVRMMPDVAESVFKMSKKYGKGTVPSFTRYGGLQVDAMGALQMKTGSRTLIIVEDRPGIDKNSPVTGLW